MRGNLGAPCRVYKRLWQSEEGTLQLSFWAQLPLTWSHAGTSWLRNGGSSPPCHGPRMLALPLCLHPTKAGWCCVGGCVLNRGTALDELLKVPDRIVDLIYCTFDLLQNTQQQNLIQAPSQHCRQLLGIHLGCWPFPWGFLGLSPGKKVPGSLPKGSADVPVVLGTTGGCRSHAWVLLS